MSDSTWSDYKSTKHLKPMPLKGIRVLEVCTILLGPAGPGFLASMGATVIKCEIPPLGDTCRELVPFGYFYRDTGPALMHINPNKHWLGLNLHKPEAQALFRELAASADIIEDNLRPGVMERWNIGYRQIKEINPGVIYISKNGFGQWGSYAAENRPSNDGASQALSGFAWMSRFPNQPPLKSRLFTCDSYGALMGEVAVLAALHYRNRTRKGQYIELSQSENIMRTMSWIWPYQQITGETPPPQGNRDVSLCPADTFYCADGNFVAIAAPAPDEFRGLCSAMGQDELADDRRFKEHGTRLIEENATAILDIIAAWARTRTAVEVEEIAVQCGFAASRVLTNQGVIEDPSLNAHGFINEVDDPVMGKFREYEFPVMMSKTPPRVKWSVRPVGFDNEFILRHYMGKSGDEIQALYDCAAVGKWADVRGHGPPQGWDGKAGLIMSHESETG